MDLTADYIHPTPHGGRCRVRIYLPEEDRDAPVVICSELPTNRGMSVTNAAERIAAEVIKQHKLPVPVWIEQRVAEMAYAPEERFALVVFSDHEVRELPPYLGVRLTIGEPTWTAPAWRSWSAGRCDGPVQTRPGPVSRTAGLEMVAGDGREA